MNAANELREKGCIPSAVLGYCFGEYAASIVAGILSEESVVGILVRRAMALRNTEGGMLNVFCAPNIVRQVLASVSSPPNIAIYVGPNHVVLSGSTSQIEAARQSLARENIKMLPLNTALPFHSAQMDGPLRAMATFVFTPKDTSTVYVSGVTGAALRGKNLSMTYWQRHMREPARFYDAMLTIRSAFPDTPIVDMGPGPDLTKVIARYGWSETRVLTPDEYILPTSHTQSSVRPTSLLPESFPQLSLASALPQPTAQDPYQIAIGLLTNMFGYQASSDLLHESLHTLGLQSMDFIQFSQIFSSHTGLSLSLSAFVSDAPLNAIISNATKRTNK